MRKDIKRRAERDGVTEGRGATGEVREIRGEMTTTRERKDG